MSKTLEISIPVLNEEETLIEKVTELRDYLTGNVTNLEWTIVIADNGSDDKTPELSKQLGEEDPRIRYIKVPDRGVGLALKHVWKDSTADIIACMDLDLSTDIKHISGSIDAIEKENKDLVYASRLHKKSKVEGRSAKREFTSRMFNLLIRTYLGAKISDSMCGFIFMKKDIYQSLYENGAQDNRWFFQAQLLIISDWLGYNIHELPVHWIDDPNSKVDVVSLAKEYLISMRKLKKKRSSIKKAAR